MAQVAISLRAATRRSRAAGEFGIGLRELEAEGGRLGVNAMRAADRRRIFVLQRAALYRGEQSVDIGDQQIGGARQLHGEAGVEHVGAGHALMHEARIRADEFAEMGQEGDDVMLGHALDLVDARDVEGDEIGLVPDRLGALLGDDADLGERVAGIGLDLEPDAKARLRLPDLRHLGAGIAGDHGLGRPCEKVFAQPVGGKRIV